MRELQATERQQLADGLGDSPFTVISAHLLRLGLCDAYLRGDPAGSFGAVVRDHGVPDEPAAFGNAPELIAEILESLSGWSCVNIATELARPLGRLLEARMSVSVRLNGERYYALQAPVREFAHGHVRQLTHDDLAVLEAAPELVRARGFGGAKPLIERGFAAAALVEGRVVSLAQTYARTKRHADIGVATLPDHRERGYATAASSIVARRLQEARQIPVWSTSDENLGSQRVARKLGFTEVGRRVYLCVAR